MSECMIIRRGGGANIDAGGAVLICETKAENSASISKSGKTVRLTPDKAFNGSDAGKANYIFPISKSDLGVWTLEVSKDEESNSKDVTLVAGQLLIEKLNIDTGIILSPETGLADGINISRGRFDASTNKIKLAALEEGGYSATLGGFDPDSFSKATIVLEKNGNSPIIYVSCVITNGGTSWGSANNLDYSNAVVNRTSFDPPGESESVLSISCFSSSAPSITSIIFE